jgi:uncharacterized protein (DUF427 family)
MDEDDHPGNLGRRNGSAGGRVVASMSAGHEISIHPSDAHVEVAVNGVTLASSDRVTVLEETGLPTRYYLPREDVRMDLLRRTSFETTCPFKGQASYWSLDLDGDTIDGIVWSYETPIEGAEAIRGLLCFYPERVELTVAAPA